MKKVLLMCMMVLGIIGQAQVQLGSGTSLDSTSEPIPWSNYFKFSYTQQIIKKSDLNTNAGNITGLKFYLASSRTLLNSDQIVVYLGHVSNDAFSSNTSWVPSASLTQVFSGTVTNNSGVVEITFATPFAYNNIDNLVIAIDENKDNYDTGGGTSEYFYKYSVPNNSTLSYRSDTVNPDPLNITLTGTRAGYRSVTQIIGLTPNTPPCTTVSSPATNATGVSITPTITWGLSPSATSYIVNLGTTPGGTNVLNAVDVGNVTSYSIPTASPLVYQTAYYLTVIPKNITGNASGCTETSFTTRSVPCPTVSAPSSAATGASLTPTFTWSTVTGATGYRLTVGTTVGGSDILNNFDVGNVLTYVYNTPLNYNTKYYYTVNSYSATSVSASCTERNFTTKTLCPSVTAPSSNATGASLTPTFTWSANSDATGYRISIGTSAGATDVLNNVDVGNVLTYVYNGVPLNYNTKYFYTVNGYNGSIASTGCTERNFTTITLCPTVSAPVNNATGTSTTPTFTWADVQGATGYRLTVGTTAGGSDIVNNFDLGNVTTYVYNNTSLNYNTKYYYTINAYSGATVSTACTERNFTTMAFCPVVSLPAANATGNSINPSISWSAVSNVTGYRLTVGTTTGGSDVINNQDLGNVTSYNFSTSLNLNTAYFYTVNAYTSNATSVSCGERKFTTTTVAPPANDDCINATALTVNSTGVCANSVTGSTVNATQSGGTAPVCGATGINDDVWYSFVATGSTHLVTVLYSDNATSTQVYSGSCGNLVAVSCFDGAYGNSNVLLSSLVSGQTYYVRVYSTSTTAATRSNFQICITTPTALTNDTCATAIAIPCNGTVNGNNALANDDVLPTSTCGSTSVAIYKGVWYTVTATVDGAIIVDACGSKFDTYLRVYTGTCSSLTCFSNTIGIGYADTGCAVTLNNASKLTFNGVAGTTYYIYLSSYAANQMGDYSIAVTQSCAGLGVNDIDSNVNDLKLYPNPFADVLNISDVKNVKSISIVDIAGRVVKTIEKPNSSLQLRELNSGMYMVILNMNDGSRQTVKAIKK